MLTGRVGDPSTWLMGRRVLILAFSASMSASSRSTPRHLTMFSILACPSRIWAAARLLKGRLPQKTDKSCPFSAIDTGDGERPAKAPKRRVNLCPPIERRGRLAVHQIGPRMAKPIIRKPPFHTAAPITTASTKRPSAMWNTPAGNGRQARAVGIVWPSRVTRNSCRR